MTQLRDAESSLPDQLTTSADESGVQYLKLLCDRRDAAVLNPVAADQYLPDAFIPAALPPEQ